MVILVLDLHIGEERKGPETLKIVSALERWESEISVCPLFSSEYNSLNLGSFDGVVLTGSNNPRLLISGKVTRELIPSLREAVESGVKLLGICAGHEVLGIAYGYCVEKLKTFYYIDGHKVENCEVGWPVVEITQLGQNHFLFRGLRPKIRPFEYHDKAIISVEESKILSRNEWCIQAFTPHQNVVGIQFHPEETPESGYKYLKEKSSFKEIAHLFPKPENYVEWRILENFLVWINGQML